MSFCHVVISLCMYVCYVSHTRTVVRECCKGDDASQCENGIWPIATPKPLNRSSQKLHTWLGRGYLPTCKI